MSVPPPRRDDVLAILRASGSRLRCEFAVASLALFGSVARDDAEPGSDVDLLVTFDRPVGYFHLFRLQDALERLLGGSPVDLVPRDAVIDALEPAIVGGSLDVFGPGMVLPNHAHSLS